MSSIEYIREIPRWTQLSIRKAFIARTENIPVFFEETFKKTYSEPLYVELRIDGPYCTPVGTRNEYESYIEVNALLSASFDEKDTMKIHNLAGVVQVALSKDFCVFRKGPNPWDDESYFETYQLLADENIQLSQFGQIDPTNKVYQATVEAHYRMRFHNGTV